MNAINYFLLLLAQFLYVSSICKKLCVKAIGFFTILLFLGIGQIQAQTFCPSGTPGNNCNSCPDYSVSNNPNLTVACQDNLNITIIIDESNSLAGSQNLVRDGVLALLQNLECNNVNVALIEFGSVSDYVIPSYTPVTPTLIASVNNYFNGIALNGQTYTVPQPNNVLGGTNWQAALIRANALPTADLVFMITDGVPTTYTVNANQPGSSYDFCGNGSTTEEAEIYNPVQLANAIKAKGSKMFILGVGSDLSLSLIQDISGNTQFDPNSGGNAGSVATSDYAVANNINDLGDSLASLSANLCPLVTELVATPVCGEGASNGTITVNITTNADAPYTITINEGTPIVTNNAQTVVGGLPAGSYEVTVSATDICFEIATSTVQVTVQTPNDAGENGALEICDGETFTTEDLFNALNGDPDEGGAWSPALTGAGTYTYTIVGDNVCEGDTAEVVVTEVTVEVDILSNVEACDEYELPVLTSGNYFTAPNGEGNALSAGNLIKETATIYIFSPAVGPCPSAESSFTVTINDTPLADNPSDVESCDEYELPALT
ncbi:vWA domain-containing protein, partial [Paucihalobacter sp.]